MSSILTTLIRATLFLIVSFGTLSRLGAQEKPGEFRDLPVRNQINRQFQLAPNTTVQISLIAGPVEIETISVARGLSMEIKQIDERGVRLSSIIGGIELALSDNLNAQFEASSVVGNVVSGIPNIKLITEGRSDFEAQIGSGGPVISISSVRGGIRLRKLNQLAVA